MPEYYTIKEVARIFQLHPRTIYRRLDEGEIKGKKIKGNWLISRAEVKRIETKIASKDEVSMTKDDTI